MNVAAVPAVDLCEHAPLVQRVLAEVRPRTVAAVRPGDRFAERLSELSDGFGFELVGEPSAADLVISAAGDYRTVRAMLDATRDQPPAAIVGGTGWPCGRRDAWTSLDDVPAAERERFAHRAPVPGQSALGDEPSPVAFATTEGGPRNGVRTALEDAVAQHPELWEVRLVPGFGGAAALLPARQASAERWAAIAPPGLLEDALSRIELANAQLRLDRQRLLKEFSERLDLERTAARARTRALAAEQAARAELLQALGEEQETNRRWEERAGGLALELERQSREREEEAASWARALREERRYVATEAQRIASSGAWRWGHRFALLKTRLTFRSTRGTDAVSRLVEHSNAPLALVSGGDGAQAPVTGTVLALPAGPDPGDDDLAETS